jgi:hypothetical protein
MPSIKAGSSKFKIVIIQNGADSGNPIIKEINESELIFENTLDASTVNSIEKVTIHFKVFGEWRAYQVEKIQASDKLNDSISNCLNYTIALTDITKYKRDFTMARI